MPGLLYHTLWPDVDGCITISGTKGGGPVCHNDMINVPLATKTGVCTIISESHLPISCGMTVAPVSKSLSQGATRLYHLGPTCTSQGHFILCVPGSKSSGAGSRRLFIIYLRFYKSIISFSLDSKWGGPSCL